MRVSERMRYDQVQKRVNDSKTDNAHAMERLASQKEITKLSDNPIGATQIVRYRDQILDMKQFQTNIEYSKGFLDRSEAALQSISDNLIRAKELSVGMANDSYDAKSRDATGREIREMIEELVQIGNTTFNGRYVFGGFRNQTPPLSLEGDYLGDDGKIFMQVSPGDFRQVNMPGRDVFEASPEDRMKGHFNMITTLEVLHAGLMNNDKDAIRQAMGELDFQLEKTSSGQASLGAMSASLSATTERLSSEETINRARLSKVQDTDMYDATSEFKRTEAVLQGTLLASTKLLQPSLLNFLQ